MSLIARYAIKNSINMIESCIKTHLKVWLYNIDLTFWPCNLSFIIFYRILFRSELYWCSCVWLNSFWKQYGIMSKNWNILILMCTYKWKVKYVFHNCICQDKINISRRFSTSLMCFIFIPWHTLVTNLLVRADYEACEECGTHQRSPYFQSSQ